MVRRQTSDESGIACGDDFHNAVGVPSPGLRPLATVHRKVASNKEGFTGGGCAAFIKKTRGART